MEKPELVIKKIDPEEIIKNRHNLVGGSYSLNLTKRPESCHTGKKLCVTVTLQNLPIHTRVNNSG